MRSRLRWIDRFQHVSVATLTALKCSHTDSVRRQIINGLPDLMISFKWYDEFQRILYAVIDNIGPIVLICVTKNRVSLLHVKFQDVLVPARTPRNEPVRGG